MARAKTKKIATRKKHPKKTRETIAIIGLGTTGVASAIAAAAAGFRVIGFESDEVRLAQLEGRSVEFLDPADAKFFRTARGISITQDENALGGAQIFLLSSPVENAQRTVPNTGPLEAAATIVGAHLAPGALVVVESVALLGFSEGALLPLIMKSSGLARGEFFFACAPARAYGLAGRSARETARAIGASDEAARNRALALYRDITTGDLVPLGSAKEAEAVFLAEAAKQQLEAAIGAEFGVLFERAGIDAPRALDALALLSGVAQFKGQMETDRALEELLRFGRERKLALHLLRAARHLVAYREDRQKRSTQLNNR